MINIKKKKSLFDFLQEYNISIDNYKFEFNRTAGHGGNQHIDNWLSGTIDEKEEGRVNNISYWGWKGTGENGKKVTAKYKKEEKCLSFVSTTEKNKWLLVSAGTIKEVPQNEHAKVEIIKELKQFFGKLVVEYYIKPGDQNFVYKYDTVKNKGCIVLELLDKMYTNDNEPLKEEWEALKDKNSNNYPHNRIIFGAPGTGKSNLLKTETKGMGEKYVTRVTFHPDYSYAHFVGCYKPYMEGEYIRYDFIAGPFLEVYKKAKKDPNNHYVLIIEEINRANVAAVFGDVFQLLDRKDDGESEYTIATSKDIKDWLTEKNKEPRTENAFNEDEAEKLSIPKNMYIWATMNSADQGVYPMDTAFKRRWTFEYMDIDGDADNSYESFNITIGSKKYNWNALRKAINDTLLDANINEDKCLGPYFIKDDINNKEFASKVLMYLYEDVVKQKPSRIFNAVLKGFSSIYKAAITNDNLEDIFSNDVVQKYETNAKITSEVE